jgi:hypothetical protein
MTRLLLCVPLLSALLGFAQQPLTHQDPSAPQPSASVDNRQPEAQDPSQDQSKSGANQRIQTSIQDLLSGDPVLSGADVEVNVDDHSIVLTGKVESYAQHQRVLQLVAQYERWRKLVDKIKLE